MLLHFWTTADGNWRSPQVLTPTLNAGLHQPPLHLDLANVTAARAELLSTIKQHYKGSELLARLPAGETVQVVQGI